MKPVVQLYKDLLPCFGLYADSDDIIRIGGGELGKVRDFLVDGKEVYLPTDEALKNANFKNKVAFNPLAENILKRRSKMLTELQNCTKHRLFSASYILIETLLHAAASQKNGTLKSTSPELLKFLVGLEDVTDDTEKFFSGIIDKIESEKEASRSIFNIYLKHGGVIKGEKYLRICSVTSPLVKALEDAMVRGTAKSGPVDVWGVTPKRKMDIGVLLRVIKTVFPLIETEGYTVGSNDKFTPYCDSLFQSIQLINKDIRYATTQLASVEPCKSTVDYLMVKDDFLDDIDDFSMLQNGVIITEYNDGDGYIGGDDHRSDIIDRSTVNQPSTPTPSYYASARAVDAPPVMELVTPSATPPQPIQRIPGTRQPLVDVPEELYRTDPEQRRRSGFRRGEQEENRGFSHPTQAPSRGDDRYIGQSPNVRSLEAKLEEALFRTQELEDELRARDRRGYSSSRRDYGDDYYDRRDRGRDRGYEQDRPVPRAAMNDRRDRDHERGRYRSGRW